MCHQKRETIFHWSCALFSSSRGFQDWTLHPRHGVWGHREEAGHKAEGPLRQVRGHGHPGTDQHCAPVLQQGNSWFMRMWKFERKEGGIDEKNLQNDYKRETWKRSSLLKKYVFSLFLNFVFVTRYSAFLVMRSEWWAVWCAFSWNASPCCARKRRGLWLLTSETERVGPRTR